MNTKKQQPLLNLETTWKNASYGKSSLIKVTRMADNLTQEEMEQLTPEQYSNYIAFGEVELPVLNEEQYERYLLSHMEFDLWNFVLWLVIQLNQSLKQRKQHRAKADFQNLRKVRRKNVAKVIKYLSSLCPRTATYSTLF